jgi:transposase
MLQQRLFARAAIQPSARRRHAPSWARLALESKSPGMTLTVLWDERPAVRPDG